MSEEKPQDQEPDEAQGTLVLMNVAGMLLQGGQATRDKRVLKLAGEVVDILKKANALEMLLMAQVQQQAMSTPTSQMPSQIAAQMLAKRQQDTTTDYAALMKVLGIGK